MQRALAFTIAIIALGTRPAAANDPQGLARTGSPAAATRIYLGMWTAHVRNVGGGLDPNSLLGFAYRGYYGATFINSYGDRAVSAGIQRTIAPGEVAAFSTAVGYRIGLVSGYDERFLKIAARTPVMPFAQIVGTIDRRNAGIELAYAGLVTSILLSFKF